MLVIRWTSRTNQPNADQVLHSVNQDPLQLVQKANNHGESCSSKSKGKEINRNAKLCQKTTSVNSSMQKLAIVKSQTWSEAWRKASLRCHYHDGAIMVLLATKKSCKREVKALPFQGLEEKCSQETVPKGRVRLAVTCCHVWVDTHLFIRIHKISLVLPLLLPSQRMF